MRRNLAERFTWSRWLIVPVAVLACAIAASLLRGGATATSGQLSSPAAPRAAQTPAGRSAFDSARAWTHLQELVAIGPRPAGSAGIRQARAYLTRALRDLGLTAQEQPFTADTPFGRIAMSNLIVTLPGRRTDRILVTGHYDTKLMRNSVFVGANDGGSSAAFLLELARVLQGRPREFTFDLVWFDGEEALVEWRGLDHTYGSRYYVQAARQANALPSIKAMLLVDMIADRDLRIRREANSTPWLVDLIWDAAARLGHHGVFVNESQPIEDDHIPFLEAGVPSVDVIDLEYPPWHHEAACCDDLTQVDARSLQIVGDVLLAALPDIEARLLSPR